MNTTKKVIVLTPNGRRQNVPLSPSTTLLQVLDQVCQKHDFASAEYGLKHHNKTMDLSLMFRFSGLPNNCLLEMFLTETSRNDDEDVVLCVQLENGERFQGNFNCGENINSVLNTLCQDQMNTNKNPVVLYMRREIYGEALQMTTLKSLGITGGRAILRLLDRNPEDLKTQANVYIAPTVKEKNPEEQEQEEIKKPKNYDNKNVSTSFSISQDAIKILKSEKMSLEEKVVDAPEKEICTDDTENITKKVTTPDWGQGSGRSINEKTEPEIESEVTQSDEITEIEEHQIFEFGERNAVVFSLESAQKVADEIPDSFFELTTDDIKFLLRDLRKQASGNDEAPLLTAKLRELEENKKVLHKLNQYKKCVIRIQFPDRLVLQGTFRPTENMSDVYEFIKKYLKNPEINFFLFTIPPKKILPIDKTLVEIDCVPTAVLHFGVEECDQSEGFLTDDILLKLTTADGALLSATKSRGLLSTKAIKNIMENDQNNSTSHPSGAVPKKPKNEDFKKSAAASDPSGIVPKWFQPIKK